MSLTIRAHFDGKVIVPDEPVDLPAGQSLVAELTPAEREDRRSYSELSIEERLERLKHVTGRIKGPAIPEEALRRENLYEERL